MQPRTLARWLVFVALVCFGLFLGAGIASAQQGGNVIQGQNGSTDSAAESEDASANNTLTFQAGPGANGTGGAPAQAAQVGDNVGSYSQVAGAHSGDAAAGSTVTGVAGRGATVQLQNSSDGAEAESEDATASNEGTVALGPQATSGTADAQASQVGDNRLDASQTVNASSGDAVAGSQVVGIAGDGDHTVQQSNVSTDAESESGDVDASNELELALGPNAESGDAVAQASQVGDNDAVWRQVTDARSGDAVAGSAVIGIVGDGTSTGQGQSSSTGADAESGDVSVENEAEAVIGPSAVSGTATASASQIGDNSVDVEQTLEAGSGDAIAGSQVTGLVAEEAGHLTVQNQQSSEDDTADSGEIDAEQEIDDLFVGPHADAGDAPAQAQQDGDNDVTISQAATLATGDALAGAQVTGAVAGDDTTIQGSNVSTGSDAESGDLDLDEVNSIDDVVVGPDAVSDTAEAQASQVGDNALSIDQTADVASGDAVAGSQVTGVVDPGDVTIQQLNVSTDAEAESGDIETDDGANIVSDANVGPVATSDTAVASASQVGDNAVAISQDAALHTGDAVAGSQVSGVVVDPADVTIQNQNTSDGAEAESGEIEIDDANFVDDLVAGPSADTGDDTAQASQVGDNAVSIDQAADLSTGDAVAGSQVTGAVTSGNVTAQNQNSSTDDEAETGDIDADDVNEIDDVNVGPVADSDGAVATAAQTGDNDASLSQDATLHSGDAVAGAQVLGIVGSDDVTVQNSNTSDGSEAESGDVEIDFDDVNKIEDTVVGPFAQAGTETATASQVGDNSAELDQSAEVGSGDAVAGGQVTGVVADGGSVTAQNTNASTDASAESGTPDLELVNEVDDLVVGPSADADAATAAASQIGDNAVAIGQDALVETGDAVAGAQVSGIVSDPSDVTVQNQNVSDGAEAESGDIDVDDAVNTLEEMFVGARAESVDDTAMAEQVGDNTVVFDQSADLSTGDAVAGAQVTGVVAQGGSVTIQNQNDSTDDEAESGDIEINKANEAEDIVVGPFALGDGAVAQASQTGDNDADIAQEAVLATGDAVAGAQVVGVVADPSDVTIQNSNTSEDSEAESGDIDANDVNEAEDIFVGPSADAETSTASASQVGDNALVLEQSADVSTGDAVAGAQVTGVVASGDDVTIQNQNSATDSEAETGDATAENEAEDIFVGPAAIGDGDPASAAQVGDDSLVLSQDATAASGDAVAGAQVVGVSGDDSTVQLQNTDDASEAESADAEVENEAEGSVGPFASSTSGNANAQQNGDSDLTADQTGEASTGDVVAGGQVVGLAGFGVTALSTENGVVQAAASGDGSFSVGSAAAA
jgi:hypothetical protein